MTRFSIRVAVMADAEALPEVEQSAGEAFRQIPELAWLVHAGNMPVSRQRELIAQGACWVAVDELDRPIGFLSAEIVADGLHIWEFGVHHDWQKIGIGSKLLKVAIEAARSQGLAAITLTTFRGLRWNQLFYESFGFKVLEEREITTHLAGALRAEIDHGLPAERRCAMRLALR